MRISYLHANKAWVLQFGEQLIDLDGQTLFATKADINHALRQEDLVADASGNVTAVIRSLPAPDTVAA